MRGHQRAEARSNTSEEEPQGKEEESFELNEIFQKKNFFTTSFFPDFYKLCVMWHKMYRDSAETDISFSLEKPVSISQHTFIPLDWSVQRNKESE